MSACIRRPSSYWTTCKCPPCALDRRRKAKRARTVGIERVPSEVAWSVMDELLRRGWTGQAIATAAGLPRRSIEGAITELRTTGRKATFGPVASAKIVTHGPPRAGQIGAAGARRRLQGLAAQGWDLERLQAEVGINASTLAAIRSGHTDRISVRKHDAVVAATERIGLRVNESRQARQNAARKGWVGLLAWTDIDDPNERPNLGGVDDQIDPVVVDRLVAQQRVPSTRAEKFEAMRRWVAMGRPAASLCAAHGWRQGRYVEREDGAA